MSDLAKKVAEEMVRKIWPSAFIEEAENKEWIDGKVKDFAGSIEPALAQARKQALEEVREKTQSRIEVSEKATKALANRPRTEIMEEPLMNDDFGKPREGSFVSAYKCVLSDIDSLIKGGE